MAINTFTIHFILKLEKVNKLGIVPIFAKIRLNGKKLEISTNRNILPPQWHTAEQCAFPVSEALEQLNEHLEYFKVKLYSTYS
ncbi:MAG TPA: Arm DNA-binding domain-containing protein [Chitinophagaceae bacterium]|jgi:hypothetical protein|nr:Arm DNA-binding domain-containing protein [Chitinophagaceae bacterium]